MRRREFIALVSGAAAWPFPARAQQTKVWRVGALLLGIADAESFRAELREGLRSNAYIEGQNLRLEFRSAEENPALLPKLAGELVALKVDAIVALFTPCALAAQKATRDIPIVVVAGDPVNRCAKAGDDDHPYRHAFRVGARAARSRSQPRTAGWQRHRSCLVRLDRQADGTLKRNCSKSEASRIRPWGRGRASRVSYRD